MSTFDLTMFVEDTLVFKKYGAMPYRFEAMLPTAKKTAAALCCLWGEHMSFYIGLLVFVVGSNKGELGVWMACLNI